MLNIAWVEDAFRTCSRHLSAQRKCPRTGHCNGAGASRALEITDVREEILSKVKSAKRRGGVSAGTLCYKFSNVVVDDDRASKEHQRWV